MGVVLLVVLLVVAGGKQGQRNFKDRFRQGKSKVKVVVVFVVVVFLNVIFVALFLLLIKCSSSAPESYC